MENGKSYDLPTLLKLKDFDIREIAVNNEELLVTEYFDKLTQFLKDSLKVMDGLEQIISLNDNEKIFQSLADIKILLSEIGCNKFTSVINGILDAGGKGNKEVAAICAEKVSADFLNFYSRIRAAEGENNTGATETQKNDKLSLKALIDQLDHGEANRKLRVLAVDDASFMLSTISAVLKNDYEVFSLTKGRLVEKFLQHTTPELFLLDYTMPEINGFELIPIIRSFEEHKDTPIIFLTAMGTTSHVSEAIALGACDYVVKPVNAEILCSKIAKHIVRKKAF